MSNEFKGPTFRYDPATGEGRIFTNSNDVPEGWVDRLPDGTEEQPVKATDDFDGMARADITKALEEGGIKYRKNDSTAGLYTLLRTNLSEVLGDDPHYKAEMSVPDMLKLVAG